MIRPAHSEVLPNEDGVFGKGKKTGVIQKPEKINFQITAKPAEGPRGNHFPAWGSGAKPLTAGGIQHS